MYIINCLNKFLVNKSNKTSSFNIMKNKYTPNLLKISHYDVITKKVFYIIIYIYNYLCSENKSNYYRNIIKYPFKTVEKQNLN